MLEKRQAAGRRNYCDFDADSQAMNGLLRMTAHAKRIVEQLPGRSEWEN